ncbi:MAG TPA: GTP-binding protein [Xanthobacteraceae bacterium]|nr:GTP-binding protein [Xanthobacteraceae bacterium]
MTDSDHLIPVSVLTGFLGSGKTTLLSHLLRQPELARAAVIINEFGEIGIDHELVETSEDNVVALTTGCLCCKVRSDLTETLHDLLRRREQGSLPQKFDHIVIETSGLADPAPILHALMTDASLVERVTLGSVVTTVDAVAGEATLAREAVSRKQVAVADRILLTKLDLSQGDARALRERIAALNPGAPTLCALLGRIDAADLFANGPQRDARADVDAWLGTAHAHHHEHHDAEIISYTIVRAAPIRAVALTLLLEALAEHCGADLLRLKGIVNIAESPQRPAVIHGVQHVFHAPAWLERWPSADRTSRMVFITRRIPRRFVELLLDAIGAEVESVSAAEVTPP